MEAFGIIGMTFGIIALGSSSSALVKIAKLEKQPRETGLLDKEYKSDKE